MRMKSMIGRALGAALLSSALCMPALAADKVVFQLDWLPGGDKSPIYICIQKGFCKEAGIVATIAPGRGSTESITRLATGASDIGIAGIEALMAARVKENVPVVAVMSIFNKGPHAFFTIKGNNIEQIQDVRGKRIATSPFTASNVFLPLVLAEMGMSEKDITLTRADPGALGPMLMTGATDAIIAWVTDVSRYTNQAKDAGKEIMYFPWSTQGLTLYSASLVASEKFLKERPDVARRFIAAYKKSMEYARTNPDGAVEAVVATVPELSPDRVRGQLQDAMALMFNEITEAEGLGVFTPKRLAETWSSVSKSLGLDPASLDPQTVVDHDFAPKSGT